MPSKISYPLILVNLKTYREGMGRKAVELAKTAERVHNETGVCIAVAPQTVDIPPIIKATCIPIFAQHVDPVGYGKYTGHILPEAMAEAGCAGTLISHSERRLELETIKATIESAKGAELAQVVCVDKISRGRQVAPFSPDAIAIEPPELIGTGTPVSKAKPEIVSGSVEEVHKVNPKIKVLCGAGITSGEDVTASLSLGAEGILVASGVVKAESPYEKLLELANAMKA
jgi:triosephosphate isomerase